MISPRPFSAFVRSSRGITCTAALLLTIFAGLCLQVAHRSSPTFDEPEQLAIGYASLTEGIHSYSAYNLRFSQIWEALPLLAFDPPPRLPTREEQKQGAQQNVYFGRLFLFSGGRDAQQMIFASRTMVVLLSVILGWVVFSCSRRLHGGLAGLLSLTLYVCSPLVIAHSSLATTEIATALLLTLSTLACWRAIERPSPGRIALAGLATGVLLATKISGVLIVPIVALCLLVRLFPGKVPTGFPAPRPLAIAGGLVAAAFLAWLVVWAVYGGPGSAPARNPAPWTPPSAVASKFATDLIAQAREWRVLPEYYLFDLFAFTHTGSIRRAYLLGGYSVHGWWYFFPVAWLVKNPLPMLFAPLAAAAAAWRLRRRPSTEGGPDWRGLVPFGAIALVYGCSAVCGNLNIGARHLLPLYPAVLVFAGYAARLSLPSARLRSLLLVALFGGSAAEIALAHPHHLGYFNAIAGGSRNGYRVLVDSSSDWGEALPDIRRWLDQRQARLAPGTAPLPVHVSIFGNADFSYYGLGSDRVVQLPQYYDNRPISVYSLSPGTYVISATMLSAVYNGPYMGPWRAIYEKHYQERLHDMAELQPMLYSPETRDAFLARNDVPVWMKRLSDFDYLRFGRLCAYLRQREPDEWITPGILVYELTASDLETALSGPPPELLRDDIIKGADRHPAEELDFVK